MWTSLPIPTPPGVIKAPVVVLVEFVVVFWGLLPYVELEEVDQLLLVF
jgi:hypothetical protein